MLLNSCRFDHCLDDTNINDSHPIFAFSNHKNCLLLQNDFFVKGKIKRTFLFLKSSSTMYATSGEEF